MEIYFTTFYGVKQVMRNRVIKNKEQNLKITCPVNPDDPLIVEPINDKEGFELDLEAPELKQYARNGKLNFKIKSSSKNGQ